MFQSANCKTRFYYLPKLSLNSCPECQQVFLSPTWSHVGQRRQDPGSDVIDGHHVDLVPGVPGVHIEHGPEYHHQKNEPTQSRCSSS